MIMKSGFHIVKHCQIFEQTDILERPRDPRFVDLRRLLAHYIFSVQCDDPLVRLIHSGQKIEDRSFSRAVRTDQTVQPSFFDLHMKFVDCTQSAKGDSKIFYFQQCHNT